MLMGTARGERLGRDFNDFGLVGWRCGDFGPARVRARVF
jgi:hypothetical protein